ncbi:ABC-three component system middle component 1 [Paraburkholderia sp. MM5482-R1]|uniref:ABC-three component system middle component 1 n=1 Tax=unclassified Paraburkholderia TaxID=2615204 RepID=UPI003D1C7CCC
MPNLDAADLAPMLLQAAGAIGAMVTDAPEYLKGDRFNSEVLSDAISDSPLRRQRSDLPESVEAVVFDGFPVLLGVLNGPPNRGSVGTQVLRYRNQATIARSWLGVAAPNLHLFLAGPVGAFAEPDWRQLAAEIEADDRVCRKLVWLFNDPPTADNAKEFLERTFVARPWPAEQRTERLDSVADFSLPDGWEDALQDQELDFAGLVDRLIELQRGKAL